MQKRACNVYVFRLRASTLHINVGGWVVVVVVVVVAVTASVDGRRGVEQWYLSEFLILEAGEGKKRGEKL